MKNTKYSITSNEVKLFKHLDNLKSIQNGVAKPVMFHIAPTNKCNMTCTHCCFEGRDKSLELSTKELSDLLESVKIVGAEAIEWTGGGEPTLYRGLADATRQAKDLGLAVGMCTNGLVKNVDLDYSLFDWVRVSMNVFDKYKDRSAWKSTVKEMQEFTKVTACYVASKDITESIFYDITSFANMNKIPTRITPDCIQPKEDIQELIDKLKGYEAKLWDNKYAFISDFNTYLGDRIDDKCMIHMIKPFVFPDGFVYSCPSSELAPENGKTVPEAFRICAIDDIVRYYEKEFQIKDRGCSYCKYTKQNEILKSLIVEVDDVKFV